MGALRSKYLKAYCSEELPIRSKELQGESNKDLSAVRSSWLIDGVSCMLLAPYSLLDQSAHMRKVEYAGPRNSTNLKI